MILVLTPPLPRGMRLEDAADYCGISASKLTRCLRPSAEIGRTKLWYREDLDAWLDERAGRARPLSPWDEAAAK